MVNAPRTAEAEARSGRVRRRRPASSRSRILWVTGGIALVLSVAGSALLIGAQHTEVIVPVTLLAALSALLLRPRRVPWVSWLLLGLAAYTSFQLVPLPFGWVEALSPAAAAVWSEALEPFGEPAPGWASLSVDPGATALESAKWFGYVCVLLAACGLRERRGGAALAALVFLSALAVSLVTLAHGIFDASHIYGLFVPNGNSRWIRGPIVNANSLAGYLNLGLFAGVGLFLSRREGLWVRIMPIGFAVLALHVVLTGSRGGVGSLALGTVALAFLVMRQRRPDWLRVGGIVSGLLLVSLVIGIALAGPEVHGELLDPSLGAKATAWRWTLDLIRDFPIFGAGRGAFETAFQPYRQPLGRDWTTIFAHAENFPLEWLADWGVPVALAALAGCVAVAPGVVRRALRDPLASGLATGLAMLFLQNLVDLGLEVFAVTAAALVAFAAIQSPKTDDRRWALRLGAAVGGVVVACAVIVATTAKPVKIERERVSRHYGAFVKSGSRNGAPLFRELRASIRRHPADAYFPMMGALVSSRSHRGDPMRWLARALERGPMNGTTHVVLAQALAARGARRQALIHVRLAALYDVTLRDYAFREAIVLAHDTEELVSVFPAGQPGAELLDDLCEAAHGERRIGCWREALTRRPSANARHRLVSSLLDAMEDGEAPCAGEGGRRCADEVDGLLRGLRAERPPDPRTAFHLARQLAFRGDFRKAAESALEGCPASPEAAPCLTRALDYAGRSSDMTILSTVVERYIALRCGDAASCGSAEDAIAAKYMELRAWGLALRHSSAAAKAEPTAERWLRNAEAAAHAGSTMTARISLDRATHAGNLDESQRRRMAMVETLLVQAPGGLH